ncbi:hypothetical protein KFK09_023613 [Dendrobium nobile]|uniref:DNA-directed RNA polymerase subunit n=1 Tax=Dendrobium nobile TaxID=94219 RepID=A0A8T3AGY6_DENNO|nr:hypothetical protein KFK09_023613 [Dendrobium nobile]
MVFLEIGMNEDIVVPFHMLDLERLPLPKVILLNLLHRISCRKASNEHGYYIAITTLNTISELHQDEDTGAILFTVSLSCTTVKPCKGEILIGTVTRILEDGIILKSGPMNNILLSETRMNDYELDMSEEPMFLKVNGLSYIKKGTKVRFKVLDIKWIEREKEFIIWATILDDYLGPI